MKTIWRDIASGLLAVLGGVVVFAKLESYSWWLLGTWKGAVGVLAVTGLAILALNVVELVKSESFSTFFEAGMWLVATVVAVLSMFVTTTRAEFIITGAFIGLAWATELARHIWSGVHHHNEHFVAAH